MPHQMPTHEFERYDRIDIRYLNRNATITIYSALKALDAIGGNGIQYNTDTNRDQTVVAKIVPYSIDGRSSPMGRSLVTAVNDVPSRSTLPEDVLDELDYSIDDVKDDDTPTQLDVWIATYDGEPVIALTRPVRHTIEIAYDFPDE
jgi:hypothetical protein